MIDKSTQAPKAIRAEIDGTGYAIIPNVVSDERLTNVVVELAQLRRGTSARKGGIYAARNLFGLPSVRSLAKSDEIRCLVESILGALAFPVRGILFDKTPGANWHVGWHQDQVIPVAERMDVPEFSAWSIKEGVTHVRAPASVLGGMLTLRIHIDDCYANNGAMQLIAGTHQRGVLTGEQISRCTSDAEIVVCEVTRGSVLAMRPLLLHRSSPAVAPTHRRVIHMEFAAHDLPGALQWASINA